ncbi:MAG TPA: ribonuclease catalytic domain-containing protein [Desulfotignum sp.]|nr:ribonuclease catalytic domain-containing protein [Desulfotignum sp.]
MKIGTIVEYIDQQKIITAVILSEKNDKLKLLNENSREVSLSEKRLTHASSVCLDVTQPRSTLIQLLKAASQTRKELSEQVDIREIWEILHEETQAIDVAAMTVFCFDPPLGADHEAAVIRAVFNDRLYFKFNQNCFESYTPEQVAAKQRQIKDAERRDRLIQKGAAWLTAMQNQTGDIDPPDPDVREILKAFYLFGNDSIHAATARQILRNAGLTSPDPLFQFFVRSGVWQIDENVDLLAMGIPTTFSPEVTAASRRLLSAGTRVFQDQARKDLTRVPLITIDGQSTMDYDDAISLEHTEQGYLLGIHIIDVGAYIRSGDPIDLAARERASSIYMPDDKLPMLPADLSDDLCSLKAGELRPAISTLIHMNRFFEIQDVQIVASIIQVHKQMSYAEANLLNGKDDPITSLHKIATLLREKRLKAGAVQITLPEVNVWLEDNKEIRYAKVDRENPSRMLVSELMIFANSLMAKFLADHKVPAVFRSQPPPSQRLFKGIETALLPNLMQRKHLSRAVISTDPQIHSGLGVAAYATATSPIRRYHDLLTQRQIKSILGLTPAYSKNDLENILQSVSVPMANAGRVQGARKRYWLIKLLETMRGSGVEALVLESHRDHYMIVLKEFMLEARLPASGLRLKQGDVIQVTVQHADARRNLLSLFCA